MPPLQRPHSSTSFDTVVDTFLTNEEIEDDDIMMETESEAAQLGSAPDGDQLLPVNWSRKALADLSRGVADETFQSYMGYVANVDQISVKQ